MKETGSPKVSVIVPMYKCESFVNEALDMICGQSFSDTEIICVLDGPDEKLRSAVEARQKSDDRIILIEQDHAGAGAARNTGLERARGDYLLFLDADDLFNNDMIERLYNEAMKYDAEIVMCSYTETNEWKNDTRTGVGFDFSLFPENKVIDPYDIEICFSRIIAAPWNKLFLRSTITENGLEFSTTRIANDVFFVVAAMTCARRLVVIKDDLLTVRRYINDDSISTNRAKYSEDTVDVMEQVYQWMRKNGKWKRKHADYCNLFKNTFIYQASYDYNERFLDVVANTLSTRMPWKRMSNAELVSVLDLQLKDRKKSRKALANTIEVLNDNDPLGRRMRLKMIDNQIETIQRVRSLMKSKYGRDLSKRDNPIRWLCWSLRSAGLGATVKKAAGKIIGEQTLSFNGVICEGHLTTGSGYIICFLPVNVKRETAQVEDLSATIRCNGYYPTAISGKNGDVLTPLGPGRKGLMNGGTPTRKNEVNAITAEVSPGIGITFQIRFKRPLVRNKNGDRAHNNQPVSVMLTGKIRLK